MSRLHTFSIVARDAQNGQMGVAVQSHWFAVGAICPWAEAGVGAIATQSQVEISYGPLGLDLLRRGIPARKALDELLSEDKERELRQVAIVDSNGNVAVHTGSKCTADARHVTGAGFSAQANMMRNSDIWPAMSESYQQTKGDLAEKMLAAMQAAQSAGGDLRGKQSAAMLIVDGAKGAKPWEHILFNIRVDDNPEPITELERLLKV